MSCPDDIYMSNKTFVFIRAEYLYTVFISLMSLVFLNTPSWAQGSRLYVDGEVIVKLREGVSQKETYSFMGKAQVEQGMSLKQSLPRMKMYHYSLKAGKSVEQTIEDLRQDPSVEYAEPNYVLTKASVSEIQAMSVEEVESLAEELEGRFPHTDADIRALNFQLDSRDPAGGPPVVAVIDTGLDLTHNVFAESDAVWRNSGEIAGNKIDDDGNGYVDDVHGWNFVQDSGTIIDDDGHGTHVSGIVLGVGINILTVPLLASPVQVMPLKFLDSEGIGNTANAVAAIYYAIENGAQVINNSWGGPHYSVALHEAVAYSYERGVVFVAAAGNNGFDNDDMPMYPSSYDVPHVISVAATTVQDQLAVFSNFGVDSVDLGSPGVLIWSTIPDNRYGYSSGTSMSAPFISGLAALMLVEAPEMKGYQVKSIIFQEADLVEELTSKLSQGSRVNVEGALGFARVVTVSDSQPTYKFTAAERELASETVGSVSCGTLREIYRRSGGRPSSGGGKGPGSWVNVGIFLSLMMIPLFLTQYLRRRNPSTQRRHERFQVNSDIKIRVDGSDFVGSVSTVSMGGLQINTEDLLERGGVVEMTVSSPDGKEQIKVQGRVVWKKEKEAYGVEFAKGHSQPAFAFLSSWVRNGSSSG